MFFLYILSFRGSLDFIIGNIIKTLISLIKSCAIVGSVSLLLVQFCLCFFMQKTHPEMLFISKSKGIFA